MLKKGRKAVVQHGSVHPQSRTPNPHILQSDDSPGRNVAGETIVRINQILSETDTPEPQPKSEKQGPGIGGGATLRAIIIGKIGSIAINAGTPCTKVNSESSDMS